ncbi:hypothetical protein MMC26_005232 [Xylographa opegraphella]|nr:hypothetical protein [Xylographa opegraphella]
MEDPRSSRLKDQTASTFPFDKLLPEIQLLIAKESVYSTTPVAIGCPPGSLSRPGGYAAGILRTCRAFNREYLYKLFYENNVFELMNDDWASFFQHHRKIHIQRVILRTGNLKNWRWDKFWLVEGLHSLENLQDLGIRVNGRWNQLWVTEKLPLRAKYLKNFLQVVCRFCMKLRVVQILINHDRAKDMISGWSLFLESILDERALWPAGMPDGRKPIAFLVS